MPCQCAAPKLAENDVIEALSCLMLTRKVPEYMGSDNGSEFTANCIRRWLGDADSIHNGLYQIGQSMGE